MKKLFGFWNDRDGWSITDVLSIIFTVLFGIVSIMMFIKLWKEDLTMQSVDFFQVFSYPMLVILSGYFGDKIMDKINFNRQKRNNEINNNQSTYTQLEIQQPIINEDNYYQEYQIDENYQKQNDIPLDLIDLQKK